MKELAGYLKIFYKIGVGFLAVLLISMVAGIVKSAFSERNVMEDKVTKHLFIKAGIIEGVLLEEFVVKDRLINSQIYQYFPGVFTSEIGLDIPRKLYALCHHYCSAVGVGRVFSDLGRFDFTLTGIVCLSHSGQEVEYGVRGYVIDSNGNKSESLDSGKLRNSTKVLLNKGKRLSVKIIEFTELKDSLANKTKKELEIMGKLYRLKATPMDCSDMKEVG